MKGKKYTFIVSENAVNTAIGVEREGRMIGGGKIQKKR